MSALGSGCACPTAFIAFCPMNQRSARLCSLASSDYLLLRCSLFSRTLDSTGLFVRLGLAQRFVRARVPGDWAWRSGLYVRASREWGWRSDLYARASRGFVLGAAICTRACPRDWTWRSR